MHKSDSELSELIARQILDTAKISTGLIEDPSSLVERNYKIMEKLAQSFKLRSIDYINKMPNRNLVKNLPVFNRELSWLAFNRRVLEQAQSKEYPLLDMKFLAFVSSNLDGAEIRVTGVIQQIKSGMIERGPDGQDSRQLLAKINTNVKTHPKRPQRI